MTDNKSLTAEQWLQNMICNRDIIEMEQIALKYIPKEKVPELDKTALVRLSDALLAVKKASEELNYKGLMLYPKPKVEEWIGQARLDTAKEIFKEIEKAHIVCECEMPREECNYKKAYDKIKARFLEAEK